MKTLLMPTENSKTEGRKSKRFGLIPKGVIREEVP